MGVRIVRRPWEPIEEALRRFNYFVWRFGPPGALKRPRWYKKPLWHYLKPSLLRRRRWLVRQAVKRGVPLDCQGRIPKRMSKRKSWPKFWSFGRVRLVYSSDWYP